MDRIEDIKKTPNYQESLPASEALLQLQERLDKILRVEMEGVIMRSKAQFVEKGERCTKYFFGLEKNRGKKKIINKLVDELTDETLLTQEVRRISLAMLSPSTRISTPRRETAAQMSSHTWTGVRCQKSQSYCLTSSISLSRWRR